jgi:hypothetical protein
MFAGTPMYIIMAGKWENLSIGEGRKIYKVKNKLARDGIVADIKPLPFCNKVLHSKT